MVTSAAIMKMVPSVYSWILNCYCSTVDDQCLWPDDDCSVSRQIIVILYHDSPNNAVDIYERALYWTVRYSKMPRYFYLSKKWLSSATDGTFSTKSQSCPRLFASPHLVSEYLLQSVARNILRLSSGNRLNFSAVIQIDHDPEFP